MRIVHMQPPIYDELLKAFPAIRGYKPFFAWGDTIYNPHRVVIPPELIEHERVHGVRQLGTALAGTPRGEDAIRSWWHRYMTDARFRLMEELLAHAAEYRAVIGGPNCNRKARRGALKAIAQRLASPLYGSLISVSDAMIAIDTPEKPFRTRLPEQAATAI